MEERLKYRMYFFVPYNISPIQQAIQAGHAALEYARQYSVTHEYIDFMKNDKTWIILNGGTTNSKQGIDKKYLGTLDNIADELYANKINCAIFCEPDLNDALTAVCFLADEKVWDYEKYPDFEDSIESEYEISSYNYDEDYQKWIEMIGEKNLFLRELIKGKRLA